MLSKHRWAFEHAVYPRAKVGFVKEVERLEGSNISTYQARGQAFKKTNAVRFR